MIRSLAVSIFILINILTNLLGIIRSKLFAIWGGAAQVGVLGQLLAFYSFETKFVTFSTKISIINLLKDADGKLKRGIVLNSIIIIIISNSLFFCLVFLYSSNLSYYLFGSYAYSSLILILSSICFLYSVKDLFESIYQSENKFKIIASGQIAGLITATVFIIPLIYYLGIAGVLIDFAIWFIIAIIFYLYKSKFNYKISFTDLIYAKKSFLSVLKISSLNVIRHLLLALSLVILRIIVIQSFNLNYAGYFQSIWSITNYVNILIAGFTFYFLPAISSYNKQNEFIEEVNNSFELLLHVVMPIIFLIQIFPVLIIQILFSQEFVKFSLFLKILAFGKIFESVYLFFIMILVSKIELKKYLSIEFIKSILMVLIPFILIKEFEFAGCIIGIVATSIICLILLIVTIVNKNLIIINKQNILLLLRLILGSVLIIIIPDNLYFYTLMKLLIGIIFVFYILNWKKYTSIYRLIKNKMIKRNKIY